MLTETTAVQDRCHNKCHSQHDCSSRAPTKEPQCVLLLRGCIPHLKITAACDNASTETTCNTLHLPLAGGTICQGPVSPQGAAMAMGRCLSVWPA